MLGNALRAVPENPARTLPAATASDASFRQRLQVHHRVLSQDLTGAIAEKARSEGTTVFGALSAAAILAGRSLSNRWRTEALRLGVARAGKPRSVPQFDIADLRQE